MTECFILAASRTAVAPAGGALAQFEAYQTGAAVIQTLLEQSWLREQQIDYVIAGNALYAGGNPARMALLAAGLPASCPAMTLDTQCAGGMDAVSLGQALIASGQAQRVIAGGLESWSLAPRRFRVPRAPHQTLQPYVRPAFSPLPGDDPELADTAHAVARRFSLNRDAQATFACKSHAKARAASALMDDEITPLACVRTDTYTRELKHRTCTRAPLIAGTDDYAISTATTAVSADGAAFVLLGNCYDSGLPTSYRPVRIAATAQAAVSNRETPLAPVPASRQALARAGYTVESLAVVELMEAYAAQAQACIVSLDLPPDRVNRGGGALARGHPVGASGAINLVRLFHELQRETSGARGLATIAAAGGLGSALVGELL